MVPPILPNGLPDMGKVYDSVKRFYDRMADVRLIALYLKQRDQTNNQNNTPTP